MHDKDKKPLVVLFIDALDSEELGGCLADMHKGSIDVSATPQMVTPSILGRYLTGKDEGETGMIRVTHPYEESLNKPMVDTFLKDLRQKIFVYNVPMTLGIDLDKGINSGSGAGGQFNDVFNLPRGAYTMWEDDPDRISNQIADTTTAFFSTIRTSIRNGEFDIYFLSYRLIDTLTHFHYDEGMRQDMIDYLETQVLLTAEISNLLFFSDHGGMKKKDTFFLNQWLEEKEYLSTTVLYESLDKSTEAQDKTITEQVGPFNRVCQVDNTSQAVSYDAYDSAVDIIDSDAPVDEIIQELRDTGNYQWVKHKSELYDQDGRGYDRLPDIIPKRNEGLLVSNNCHKNAGPDASCQCAIRSGVHSPRACWGSNFNISHHATDQESDLLPSEFHHLLKYVFEKAPLVRKGAEEEDTSLSPEEEKKIHERLEALGYV